MLLRNTILFVLGQGLPALIAFASLSLYTRLVDPAVYGAYAVAFSAAMMGAAALFGWMRAGILRFTSGVGRSRQLMFATALYGYAGLAAAVLVLGVAYDICIGRPLYGFPATLLALCLAALGGSEIALTFVRTSLRGGRNLWINLVRAIVQVAVSLTLLLYAGWQGIALLTGVIVAQALCMALVLTCHWREICLGRWSPVGAARLWRFGWPTCIKSIAGFIETMLDRFLLIAMVDAAAAGVYAVGYDLMSRSLFLLSGAVSMAGLPLVVRAIERGGLHAGRASMSRYCTLLLGLMLPAVCGLWLLRQNIGAVLVGEQYRTGLIEILGLIVLAALLGEMRSYYTDFAFEAARQPKKQLPVPLIGVVATVGFNLLLIPLLGIMGAAIAAVLSRTLSLVASVVLVRRIFPLPFPAVSAAKVAASCVVMCLTLWPTLPYLGWHFLIAQVLLGAGAYGACVYALNIDGARPRLHAVAARHLARLPRLRRMGSIG